MALVVLAAIPLVAVVVYISTLGEPVPLADEWIDPLAIAIKTAEGSLSFSDLVRQYNDTRPLFANLLTVVSTHLFDWNLKAEMFFNVGLATASLLMLWLVLRRQLGGAALLVTPLLSLLVFSLAQRRSWLSSIQSQYFFLIFFFLLGMWLLETGLATRRWLAVVGSSILGLCMTFSYANGLLSWVVLPLVIWLLGYRRLSFYAYWLVAAAAGLGLYLRGFENRILARATDLNPIHHLEFLLVFLGNALIALPGPATTGRLVLAGVLGACGLALFVANVLYLVRSERSTRKAAIWIGMATLVLASGLLISIGRLATRGLEGAMAGRYITMSTVFWIALVCVGACTTHVCLRESSRRRSGRAMLVANLSAAVVLTACVLYSDYRSVLVRPWVTAAHRVCLAAAAETRDLDCLRGLHPVFDPKHPSFGARWMAMERIERMAELGLGVYSRSGGDP